MTGHRNLLWPLRAIVLILGFAFATSGFAHHITTPDEQARIAYAAALGVAVEDICAETGQQDHGRSNCEACLVGPFLAPPPVASAVVPITAVSRTAWAIRDLGPLPQARLARANPSRAPPLGIIGASVG
ncbi:polyketide synthase [Paragemmobacter ruber]|uniref:Polyketide synthase n=1 Tax=Paragemmobacter ruber TaxID=1985673 RepID=A0ABW9Y1R7_9RHOB|nr:polyketide synthase [Rhodobacter ruber]NBE06450.1 polyketide synthase [Rhodobacter ruber]